MTRIVRAYHGTTFSAASEIYHRRSPFRLSDKPGNWLGRGAYFFEENLAQAIDWAIHQVNLRARLGVIDSPAILVADLDLTHCLDLCSSKWHAHLESIAEKLGEAGVLPQQHGPTLTSAGNKTLPRTTFIVADYPMPAQTALEHFADKDVIDALIKDLHDNDEPVSSVRASFSVGVQPYSNSHFFSDTHTQIAVLTPDTVVTPITIIHPIPTMARSRP